MAKEASSEESEKNLRAVKDQIPRACHVFTSTGWVLGKPEKGCKLRHCNERNIYLLPVIFHPVPPEKTLVVDCPIRAVEDMIPSCHVRTSTVRVLGTPEKRWNFLHPCGRNLKPRSASPSLSSSVIIHENTSAPARCAASYPARCTGN